VGDPSTPQWARLGYLYHPQTASPFAGPPLAININGGEVITILGNQRFGKSVTGTCIAESIVQSLPGINQLCAPGGAFHFHFGDIGDTLPEILSALSPNTNPAQMDNLWKYHYAEPRGLPQVVLLVLAERVDEFRARFP